MGHSPQREARRALERAAAVADRTVEQAEATAQTAKEARDVLDREMQRLDEAVAKVKP